MSVYSQLCKMHEKPIFQHKRARKHNFSVLCKRLVLYGLLFVFKVLGLLPCKVNQFKILANHQVNNQKNLFELSKYGYFYNILLIIVFSSYSITVISLKLWSQSYIKSDLVDKINETLMLYGSLALAIIWLNYILQRKKIVNIVNGLYNINSNLENCSRYTFKSSHHRSIISIVNFYLCFGIFLSEIFISGAYLAVLWIAPFITSSWVLIQYTLLLNTVLLLFQSINNKITELGDVNLGNYDQTLSSKILLRESAVKDIKYINYAMMQLCDICDQISDFYAIPTFLITVYFMTSTIFNSYFVILSLITSTDKDFLNLCLDFGLWFLIVSFNFITFTLNIFRISREFKKTPQYLSLLISRCTMNSITKETLLDFLRDLTLRNVNFTSYGVITLDGSLLQTIYGTMVTYLIILIQFRNQ